jgi:hypothetical protein
MASVEAAYLRCESCGDLSLHTVEYAGRLLVATTCGGCGATVSRNAAEARAEYLRDLEQRLQSKPARVMRRALRDPKGFVTTLPTKMAAQPRKLLREWRAVFSASQPHDGEPPAPPKAR